jgi:hypothetical protein
LLGLAVPQDAQAEQCAAFRTDACHVASEFGFNGGKARRRKFQINLAAFADSRIMTARAGLVFGGGGSERTAPSDLLWFTQ